MPFLPVIVKAETDEEALANAVLNGGRKPRMVYTAYVDPDNVLSLVSAAGGAFEVDNMIDAKTALMFSDIRKVGEEGEVRGRNHPVHSTSVTMTMDALLREAQSMCDLYNNRTRKP